MSNEIQFILYQLPEEEGKVQVVIKDETIWATQKAMAQLFGVGVPAISKHLNHIFDEGELDKEVAVSKMEITTQHGAIEGKTQKNETAFYSLDAIIAVGYRVSSPRATKFRQWATKVLNDYIRKGFALDEERLKQGTAVFGKDYFRELLEKMRSIRASERRIWQQITDIYAECSFDYDRKSPTTREFYQMVQKRFHYAITGQTAPEIIYTRADHTKDHMGLHTWKNAPDGRVLLSDAKIAKNYLPEVEIRRLERAVSGYFDYIEDLKSARMPSAWSSSQHQSTSSSLSVAMLYYPTKGRLAGKRLIKRQKRSTGYSIQRKRLTLTSTRKFADFSMTNKCYMAAIIKRKADYKIPSSIDIQVEVESVPFEDIAKAPKGEPSSAIRERVLRARQIQSERYSSLPAGERGRIHCNAQMTTALLQKYVQLDDQALTLLRNAMKQFNLSARAYDRILKVSRTIADLEGVPDVQSHHIAEAIGYRNLDRDNWAE